MSFPRVNSPVNLDSQVRQVQQMQQASSAQGVHVAQQKGELSGIRSIVQMARAMEATQARQAETQGKGFFGTILSAICAAGRAIKNFFFGSAKVHPAPPSRATPPLVPNLPPAVNRENVMKLDMLVHGEKFTKEIEQHIFRALNDAKNFSPYVTIKGDSLKENPELLKSVCEVVQKETRGITASGDNEAEVGLKDIVGRCAWKMAQETAINQSLTAALEKIGHHSSSSIETLRNELLTVLKPLNDALQAHTTYDSMRSMNETTEILNNLRHGFTAEVEKFAAFVKARDEVTTAAMDKAVTKLADRIDLPVDQLRTKFDFSKLTAELAVKFASFSLDTTKDEMEDVIDKSVKAFTTSALAPFKALDKLNLSDELKDFFRFEVFTNPYHPNGNVFTDCKNAAKLICKHQEHFLDEMEACFAKGAKPTPAVLFDKLQQLAGHIDQAMKEVYTPEGVEQMSTEQKTTVRAYITMCVLDGYGHDRLGNALRENIDFLKTDVSNHITTQAQKKHPPVFTNECLQMIALADPKLTSVVGLVNIPREVDRLTIPHTMQLLHAKEVIHQIVPKRYLDTKALDAAVTKMLATITEPLTPEDFGRHAFKTLYKNIVMNTLIPNAINQLGQSVGLTFSRNDIENFTEIALSKNPAIKDPTNFEDADELGAALDKILDDIKNMATA